MKKQWILPMFAVVFAWVLLASCGSNTDNTANTNLQAPTTTQSDQAAAPAEKPATPNAEQGEKEENEAEEATEKAAKQAMGATASTPQTTTTANLITAFTGETTASAKYAAYAKKAQEEGLPQIALLFKAASASENIHANNHKAVLEDMGAVVPTVKPQFTVKTTRENLQDAIAGESYEISTMYPDFLTNAKTSNSQLAMISLNYAYKTEQKHKPLYEKALAALQNNQVKTLPAQYYICSTCGNTYDTKAPKRCGISMTSSDRFIKIDNA